MGGFLSLTIVIYLFDKKVIGWSISNGMSVEETPIAVFKIAVKNRNQIQR